MSLHVNMHDGVLHSILHVCMYMYYSGAPLIQTLLGPNTSGWPDYRGVPLFGDY